MPKLRQTVTRKRLAVLHGVSSRDVSVVYIRPDPVQEQEGETGGVIELRLKGSHHPVRITLKDLFVASSQTNGLTSWAMVTPIVAPVDHPTFRFVADLPAHKGQGVLS